MADSSFTGAAGLALVLLMAAAPGASRAAEMLAQGEVVDVVPLDGGTAAAEPDCATAAPPSGDLVSLLAWDLRPGCRDSAGRPQALAGYRVYYRWDGRTYSRIMRRRPGKTVNLRVHLE